MPALPGVLFYCRLHAGCDQSIQHNNRVHGDGEDATRHDGDVTADAEEDRQPHGRNQSIQHNLRDGEDAARDHGDDTTTGEEDD